MRTRPEAFDESVLVTMLADTWGIEVAHAAYAPVGFGSYHWIVADSAGERRFVTVDDLDHTPWLGRDRDEAFANLRLAFTVAATLAEIGLAFVVAPNRAMDGEPLRRVGTRHTVAVFPFVEAASRGFGTLEDADERAVVVKLLAELHEATPAVRSFARSCDLELQGRPHLEAALREAERPWEGGPLSERAREVVARNAGDLAAALRALDRLRSTRGPAAEWVVTHGEPHAGNVLRAPDGVRLVDWDTTALAPAERDLWWLVGEDGDEARLYTEVARRAVDAAALQFFGLRWNLMDVAHWVRLFRAPHEENADTTEALANLVKDANVRERWAALL